MKRKMLLGLAMGVLVSVEFANANPITNGLIGCWTAEGNADDSSTIGNNGTFGGSYVSGNIGQAFDLNTGNVSIPDIPAYSFGPEFSVGFWFNMNGQGNGVFLGQDDGGGGNSKWFIDYNRYAGSAFDFHINGPSYAFLASDPVTPEAGWNQFTLVKNNTDYIFYLNGNYIGTRTHSGTFPDPNAGVILGYAEPGHDFRGLMDDVVLYNRALSPTEVEILANVPEPCTLGLLSLGGLALLRRRAG